MTSHVIGVPDKGQSAKQMVLSIRESIARLRKGEDKTRKAPQPIDRAKAAFAARVDELASTPPFEVVRNGHVFDVRFPVVEVLAEPVGGVPVAFDPRPAYVATHRDEILGAGFKAIERHYEDNVSLALDENGKRVRLAEIGDEILVLERRECAVIWAARDDGEVIDFRPDTDIRAVLGIDGPPPARRR